VAETRREVIENHFRPVIGDFAPVSLKKKE
jgi:hypothetical protein